MGIGKGGVSGASLFPKSERASLCPQRKPIEAPKTKVVMMMAAKSGFPRERKRALSQGQAMFAKTLQASLPLPQEALKMLIQY